MKRKHDRQDKVRFAKAIKRMEEKLVNTWRFHAFKYRKKWRNPDRSKLLSTRLQLLNDQFLMGFWTLENESQIWKAKSGDVEAQKYLEKFFRLESRFMLKAKKLLEVLVKKLIRKGRTRIGTKRRGPRWHYDKKDIQYLRKRGWFYGENNAPPITVTWIEGGLIVHDFEKALEFLEERIRRRKIIASKGFSLKEYTKNQMWRDWNIKYPDALLHSPFWIIVNEPWTKE
jgi:hypothetical protein